MRLSIVHCDLGEVFLGTLIRCGETVDVAIKKLKKTLNKKYVQCKACDTISSKRFRQRLEFIKEAKIMRRCVLPWG